MKILAIRGENLASLDGAFEVHLESGPLGRMGLFAITGRTGAGKTTLLDALCLALFDRTPRLADRGGVLVGRHDEDESVRLAANDVRALLRRGRGAGFAEVDFLGRDGRRYRARWTVRRARGKPGGRFQQQDLTLEDLATGERIGHRKTEVLAEIEARLGLSFDQFRRSVLLAQGDFAAFLEADKDERSRLLERMTGTELYGAVSVAAFARAKSERESLERLEQEAGASAPTSPEERATLEADVQVRRAAVQEAEAGWKLADGARRWHAERERLTGGVTEAEADLSRSEDEAAAAAPLRAEVEGLEAVTPLRPLVGALDRTASASEEGADVLEAARAGLASAEAAEAGAAEALSQARAAAAEAVAALERARPDLERARALDGELGAARAAHQKAEREAAEAEASLSEARAEKTRLEGSLHRAETDLAEAARRLEDDAAFAPLAADWSPWASLFARYGRARRQCARLEAERPGLREAAAEAGTGLEQARAALASAREALQLAREAAGAAHSASAERPAAATRRERDAALARREALQSLQKLHADARKARAERVRAARDQARASELAASASARADAASREAARLEAAAEEAQLALDRARTRQDLSAHRADLRDGEPCPLCGALEHPLATEAGPLSELVSEARKRVQELRRDQEAQVRAEAAARAEAKAALGRGDELTALVQRTDAELAELARRFDEALAAPALAEGEPVTVDLHADEAPDLTEALDTLDARLPELDAEVAAREQLETAAAQAREAVEVCRRDAEAADTAVRSAEDAHREAESALRDADAEAARRRDEQSEVLAELSPALVRLDGWEEALEADPDAFVHRCSAGAQGYRAAEQAHADADGRLKELRPRLEEAERRITERAGLQEARRSERDAALQRVETLAADRGALLDGRPADAFEASLTQARSAAERAAEEAAELHSLRASGRAAARSRIESAAAARDKARESHDEAAAELRSRLQEFGLELDEARARLSRDPAWLDARKGELAELDRTVENARTVLAERRRALEAHTALGAPSLSADAAAEACARLEAELEEAREALHRVRSELEQDDRARERRAELDERIEAQRERAAVWQQLGELIGSSDGKKLRVFAQSLTLDLLLDHANAHLAELSGRYRLMRVPGQDLELQVVDGDMADEVRSIRSLSGGESFLVSLALALGLSSLAARDTRIDSLFIDEGFGSLDAQTLDAVLSALDALQATGRQVGIISHVGGVAERVGAQVRVRSLGAGRSAVEVRGAA